MAETSSGIAKSIRQAAAVVRPLEDRARLKMAAYQRDRNPVHLQQVIALQQQIIDQKSAALAKASAIGSAFEGIVRGLHPATPGPKVSFATQSAIDGVLAGVLGSPFGSRVMVSGSDMVAKMTDMNMQFLQLQAAAQEESRRFQTLTNASQARHDIALNAIRNLKG